MKDNRLRRKLFGEYSEDCLNLYQYGGSKVTGFVGQTVNKIEEQQAEIKRLNDWVIYLNDELQKLKGKKE